MHGIPSDPTWQAASELYVVHAALATQVVPSVVHFPEATLNATQSESVVAVLSVQTANLHDPDVPDATHLH